MALPKKSGICSICKKKGPTDWHHIISQAHAKKTKQFDLLDNPDNVTELCRKCHDQTTASMVRKRLTKEGKSLSKTKKRTLKKVVNPQIKNNIKKDRERRNKSKISLTRRSVWGLSSGDSPTRLKTRLNRSMRLKGTTLGSLYPSDHWLHDPKKYDSQKCRYFEQSGWKWTKDGLAKNTGKVSRDYRPPPRK